MTHKTSGMTWAYLDLSEQFRYTWEVGTRETPVCPQKEEFLQFADDNFYEGTTYSSRLEKMLVDEWDLSPETAQGIVAAGKNIKKVSFFIKTQKGADP